ncbi:MAG TPA: lysylphosphatidylglycerol synthase domain-containing protein [Gemmatimonadales bacterium]|nr:lysylphosphatidylglycerol synthase domain-containing protein [Gemmatimonadales bacterium]
MRFAADRRWRLLGLVAAALVAVFVWRTFAANWDQFRTAPLDLRLQPGWVVLAALLVWAMYALLIAAWRGLLASWGRRLTRWEAARIWALSNLAKYVPGKVWAMAGMAVMAKQVGVEGWVATGAAILMQILAVGTGALVVALAGTSALEAAHPGARVVVLLLALASAGGVGLVLWPPVASRLLREEGGSAIPAPGPVPLALAILANLAAWVGYGVALWCLARGVLGEGSLPLGPAIGVFAASYLAGLLALFAPGGLVVREALFIVLLQPALGLSGATALAVASRLLLTLTEVGVALPFLGSRRSARAQSRDA